MARTISSEALGVAGAGATLAAVSEACTSIGVPFFLVGALARDVLMHHLRGADRAPRLTQDVDVAVAVDSWARFEELTTVLAQQHGFKTTRTSPRFERPNGLLVDVIPFGDVEDTEHRISWPPAFDVEMSVLGYREALQATEHIEIDGVAVQVIPLEAFGPLKVLAWNERRHETTRDAEDFCFVLTSYWEAETERVLQQHADLFEAEEGDTDYIGARAYGREAASFVRRLQPLQHTLMDVLQRETATLHESRLAVEMGRQCSYSYERRFDLLVRFQQGVEDVTGG